METNKSMTENESNLAFKKALRNKQIKSFPSYLGWAKHCDSKHLIKSFKL